MTLPFSDYRWENLKTINGLSFVVVFLLVVVLQAINPPLFCSGQFIQNIFIASTTSIFGQ